MYINLHSGEYLDADNGSAYSVKTSDANDLASEWWIEVYNPNWATSARRLTSGYGDQEEAQAALDEFMTAHEVSEFAPPMTQEERDKAAADKAKADADATAKADADAKKGK